MADLSRQLDVAIYRITIAGAIIASAILILAVWYANASFDPMTDLSFNRATERLVFVFPCMMVAFACGITARAYGKAMRMNPDISVTSIYRRVDDFNGILPRKFKLMKYAVVISTTALFIGLEVALFHYQEQIVDTGYPIFIMLIPYMATMLYFLVFFNMYSESRRIYFKEHEEDVREIIQQVLPPEQGDEQR